jgi:iron complex outermembrane receptor protein
LLGANYAHDDVKDEPLEFFSDVDLSHLFQGVDPQAYGDESLFPAHMRANTDAVFGRVEYNATERLMIEGGVRYNADRRTFDNCSIAVTNHFASFWNLFRGGALPLTQVGDCYVLDPANGLQPVDDVHSVIKPGQRFLEDRPQLDRTTGPAALRKRQQGFQGRRGPRSRRVHGRPI